MMSYNEDHINIINNNNNNLNINMNITPNNGNRKQQHLRPLVPRPPLPISTHHHHYLVSDENKREQMVVVSSRWNPTPEQLQTLEELYRRGTRTPSADEIQHITAHLRRYGKIEGKNVFYWFQNHKARERQKRRRQLLHNPPKEIDQRKESEIEETRNWAIPTFSQKNMVRDIRRKAADEGWVAVEEEEEERRRKSFAVTLMSSTSSPPVCGIPTTFVSSQRHETLELFPINTEKCFLPTSDVNPHFIEFLPLKK